jgi:3'-phosphoadenosine 5'-phosphosulfate (PAPS) 3'-phosphatase
MVRQDEQQWASSRIKARPPVLPWIATPPGSAILAVNRSTMKVDGKTDGSPVTEADLAVDSIIAAGLARWFRTYPLSEERAQQATPV